MLALSIAHRDDILQVLVDCPEGLCELRAVLLQQQARRDREGSAREEAPTAPEGTGERGRLNRYAADPQPLRPQGVYQSRTAETGGGSVVVGQPVERRASGSGDAPGRTKFDPGRGSRVQPEAGRADGFTCAAPISHSPNPVRVTGPPRLGAACRSSPGVG